MSNGRTRVLVIGGGFGGLFCARSLGGDDVDVTLLDRAACHVFQPLLYQCATGTLSIGQISRSLREELAGHRNVTTLLGDAIDVDGEARRVTARRPDETTFVKRIVAGPGDTLSIEDGLPIVDGEAVEADHIAECGNGLGCDLPKEITIPPDHYFMMGDNSGASDDSRFWGPVPSDWIIGKVVLTYWPPDRFGTP